MRFWTLRRSAGSEMCRHSSSSSRVRFPVDCLTISASRKDSRDRAALLSWIESRPWEFRWMTACRCYFCSVDCSPGTANVQAVSMRQHSVTHLVLSGKLRQYILHSVETALVAWRHLGWTAGREAPLGTTELNHTRKTSERCM
jgi:hypothetical protein